MLLTQDYLQAEPWNALLARINDEYQTELEPYSTKLVSIESLGGTRTRVVIGPNQIEGGVNTAPPITRTEYLYDRLDLSTFFRTSPAKDLGGFTLPTDTFKILAAISELNEIVFTLNDFMHVQYDRYGEYYSLKANPKSLRFVGTITFRLINTSKRLLQSLGTKLEFPKANTWALGTDGTKMTAQYLTASFDFTQEREFLTTLDKDSVWPSGRKLAAIVQDVTGAPWVCSKDVVDWNIAFDVQNGSPRFNVLYNGAVLPRYSPRKDIDRVVVLQLSEKAANVNGFLLLHYN